MINHSANFCENCGASLSPEMRFCESCGQPVVPAAAVAPSGVSSTQGAVISPHAPPVAALPGNGRKRVGLITGLVVLLVAIGAGAGYYFWKSSAKSVGTPLPSPTGTGIPAPLTPPPALDPKASAVPYIPPQPPAVIQPPVSQPDTVSPISPPPPVPDFPETVVAGPRWPWTSERLLTENDLQFLGALDLELMRNEIYARHGWVFKRQDLQQYFQSQPWYRPKGSPANREAANRLAAAELNPLEKRNIQIIQYFEKTRR